MIASPYLTVAAANENRECKKASERKPFFLSPIIVGLQKEIDFLQPNFIHIKKLFCKVFGTSGTNVLSFIFGKGGIRPAENAFGMMLF